MKDLLSEMWDKLSFDDRLIYQNKEQDDRLRFENELKLFETSSWINIVLTWFAVSYENNESMFWFYMTPIDII